MRLGYVSSTNAHQQSLDWWAHNRQDPDTAIHLVRTWAWSPWLQEAQQRLGHALHTRTAVPDVVKELAIVRVCSMVWSPYELFHHVPIARQSGVTEAQIDALGRADGVASPSLSARDRAVVQYVDEFDAGRGVQDDTFGALATHLDPAQIVGLSLQIGYWGCNARLTKALLVENESWISYESDSHHAEAGQPEPSRPVPHLEAGGRLGVPSIGTLSERTREQLGSWGSDPPLLARAWSLVEPVCVAEHRRWLELSGANVALSARHRALVARRVAWLRHSPYFLDLLARRSTWSVLDDIARDATEGSQQARTALAPDDRALLDFVDAWETGLGVGDAVFDTASAAFDRRQLVEAQLVAGTMGTHARLATALRLQDEE